MWAPESESSDSPWFRADCPNEEAGYVAVEKKFVLRKPQTLYRVTETGRQALSEYVQALKPSLGAAIDS
jgi:hypothetical protein